MYHDSPLALSTTQLYAENSHYCLTLNTKEKKHTYLLEIKCLQNIDQKLCYDNYFNIE